MFVEYNSEFDFLRISLENTKYKKNGRKYAIEPLEMFILEKVMHEHTIFVIDKNRLFINNCWMNFI